MENALGHRRAAGPQSVEVTKKVLESRDELESLAPVTLFDPEVVPTRLFAVRDVGTLSVGSSQGWPKVSETRRRWRRRIAK